MYFVALIYLTGLTVITTNLYSARLSAGTVYTYEHILRYFKGVKTNGPGEHGLPRPESNVGILIAHDRRKGLLPIFIGMMGVCCDMFLSPCLPTVNEFSLREVMRCLLLHFGNEGKYRRIFP